MQKLCRFRYLHDGEGFGRAQPRIEKKFVKKSTCVRFGCSNEELGFVRGGRIWTPTFEVMIGSGRSNLGTKKTARGMVSRDSG